ncbi:MAG: ammonia-forming cytochrome c nitrite reductase subunit c552 [Nitrospirae bacterium]|uniref:ammonia-forming cytochrome c nitrite reductase subunit c552 n=1 Tax=Candidatus Magnetobacterium casense TaxID=1455061 RepID=UPI00058CEF11|nr:ammonia-forming cytochrome c nitrite reductase subunit c552 [Candidatus Magnetobacterium casensis]MBF0336817.1 ammonia-forming cytochrome c nitrite reductase subunit c552 [Nitrospirota bacterium]
MRQLLMFTLIVVFTIGCTRQPSTPTSAITIADDEKDPAIWGRKYPNQFDSYRKNSEPQKGYSKYRDDNACRLSPWPFQLVLLEGWGMGVEYNEPNGHTEMLRDQLKIDASRYKAGGVCLSCKSPFAAELMATMKGDYYRQPYNDVIKNIPERHRQMGLVCADCHDAATMDLKIKRPALIEALKAIGKDTDKLTRQEMRSLVCAQCHVDYKVTKDSEGKSSGLLYPWKNGKWGDITIEAVIKQIKDEGLLEWKHKVTDQKIGHIRHPEFELFSSAGSVHWAAGVACADCHMPYERVGSEKMSSHRWESPLKKDMRACMQCHKQQPQWLKQQVLNIQDRVNHAFTKAGYELATAALTIEAANGTPGIDKTQLQKAKDIYAEGYYRSTWIGAENSMGFHNPPEALRVLGDALDQGHRATLLAREAILKAGSIPPDLDMEKIDAIVAKRYGSKDGKTGFKPDVKKKAALIVH